jgi:hypothetical protein
MRNFGFLANVSIVPRRALETRTSRCWYLARIRMTIDEQATNVAPRFSSARKLRSFWGSAPGEGASMPSDNVPDEKTCLATSKMTTHPHAS